MTTRQANLYMAILTILAGLSVHAATLDCSIPGEFPQADKHVSAKLVNNMAQVDLGQAAQYQITASALGNLVVIIAKTGDQRISSSFSPNTNLRVETSGLVSEYFCTVR